MIDPDSSLRSAWSVLSRPEDQEFSSFVVHHDEGLELRAAVDRRGQLHLLLAGPDLRPFEPSHDVLSLRVRQLVFSRVTNVYLDIACTDAALDAQFREVAAGVTEACIGSSRPIGAALDVIDRWRRLLRASGLRRLQERQRIGAFAELSVLTSLNSQGLSAPAAAWTGPLGHFHDFELPVRCVEVKALGLDSSTFHVHGVQQLDTHDGRPLHLILVTVVPDDSGITIPSLVADLQDLVPDRDELHSRLNQARIDIADPVLCASPYRAVAAHSIAVGPATPRVVASSFAPGRTPSGVAHVEYEVDVAATLAAGRAIDLALPGEWW